MRRSRSLAVVLGLPLLFLLGPASTLTCAARPIRAAENSKPVFQLGATGTTFASVCPTLTSVVDIEVNQFAANAQANFNNTVTTYDLYFGELDFSRLSDHLQTLIPQLKTDLVFRTINIHAVIVNIPSGVSYIGDPQAAAGSWAGFDLNINAAIINIAPNASVEVVHFAAKDRPYHFGNIQINSNQLNGPPSVDFKILGLPVGDPVWNSCIMDFVGKNPVPTIIRPCVNDPSALQWLCELDTSNETHTHVHVNQYFGRLTKAGNPYDGPDEAYYGNFPERSLSHVDRFVAPSNPVTEADLRTFRVRVVNNTAQTRIRSTYDWSATCFGPVCQPSPVPPFRNFFEWGAFYVSAFHADPLFTYCPNGPERAAFLASTSKGIFNWIQQDLGLGGGGTHGNVAFVDNGSLNVSSYSMPSRLVTLAALCAEEGLAGSFAPNSPAASFTQQLLQILTAEASTDPTVAAVYSRIVGSLSSKQVYGNSGINTVPRLSESVISVNFPGDMENINSLGSHLDALAQNINDVVQRRTTVQAARDVLQTQADAWMTAFQSSSDTVTALNASLIQLEASFNAAVATMNSANTKFQAGIKTAEIIAGIEATFAILTAIAECVVGYEAGALNFISAATEISKLIQDITKLAKLVDGISKMIAAIKALKNAIQSLVDVVQLNAKLGAMTKIPAAITLKLQNFTATGNNTQLSDLLSNMVMFKELHDSAYLQLEPARSKSIDGATDYADAMANVADIGEVYTTTSMDLVNAQNQLLVNFMNWQRATVTVGNLNAELSNLDTNSTAAISALIEGRIQLLELKGIAIGHIREACKAYEFSRMSPCPVSAASMPTIADDPSEFTERMAEVAPSLLIFPDVQQPLCLSFTVDNDTHPEFMTGLWNLNSVNNSGSVILDLSDPTDPIVRSFYNVHVAGFFLVFPDIAIADRIGNDPANALLNLKVTPSAIQHQQNVAGNVVSYSVPTSPLHIASKPLSGWEVVMAGRATLDDSRASLVPSPFTKWNIDILGTTQGLDAWSFTLVKSVQIVMGGRASGRFTSRPPVEQPDPASPCVTYNVAMP